MVLPLNACRIMIFWWGCLFLFEVTQYDVTKRWSIKIDSIVNLSSWHQTTKELEMRMCQTAVFVRSWLEFARQSSFCRRRLKLWICPIFGFTFTWWISVSLSLGEFSFHLTMNFGKLRKTAQLPWKTQVLLLVSTVKWIMPSILWKADIQSLRAQFGRRLERNCRKEISHDSLGSTSSSNVATND